MTPRNLSSIALVGLAIALVAPDALADDVAGAANAFSKAQKAELSGDPATAAELFELADSLAPSPEALRSAIRARKAAGQLGSAALDAEALHDRYPNDARSKELADATLALAKQSLARFEITCKPGTCGLIVDGSAATSEPKLKHVLYFEPGKHDVIATFGKNRTPPKAAEGAAGEQGTLVFDAPKVEPRKASELDETGAVVAGGDGAIGADSGVKPSKGLPPWIFVTGAVVTVGLGAVTVWSGMDVLKAHDNYDGTSRDQYDEGVEKERRTNILIGATAVAGVATGVIAIFTQWKTPKETATIPRMNAGFAPVPSGGVFSVSGVY